MPSPLARRSPRPQLRLWLLRIALLAHLAQGLHFHADAHVYCATHDRIEHLGDHDEDGCAGHSRGDSGQPAQPGEDGESPHESCPFLPPALATPVGEPLPPAQLGPVEPGPVARPRSLLRAAVRHLLAPKHSPPAVL